MVTVGVHEAQATLSELLRRVAAGEEVIITHGGDPIAKLVPVHRASHRVLGQDRGLFDVPDDFNDPLPDGVLAVDANDAGTSG